MRETTSLFTLFFDSFVGRIAGIFKSNFLVGDETFSTLISSGEASTFGAESMGKLASLIESGDVVVAFVVVSSVAQLKSIGLLNLRVRRADEKRSN